MRTRKLKAKAAILLACLILISIWTVATPCPTNTGLLKAPQYIENVWPPSESETLLGCYVKRYLWPRSGIGVGVAIDMDSIWQLELPQSSSQVASSFPDRVFLYVDGNQVPITSRWEGGGTYRVGDTELDLAGWYFFGSNHFVLPGDHRGRVVVVTKSGETLKYEWAFRIR
ncbi:MAG: hypothetical protein WCC12_14845 [Anaerolineales bacterium]